MLQLAASLRGMGTISVLILVPSALALMIWTLPKLRERLGLVMSKEASDGAFETMTAIAGFTAFALAISFVEVQGYLRHADDLVTKEASKVNTLDRTLVRSGAPAAIALRPMLKTYIVTVIDKEWPALHRGKGSPEVEQLSSRIAATARAIAAEGPHGEELYSKVMSALDDLNDIRDARISLSREHLTTIYWNMVGGLVVLMLVTGTFASASLDKRLSLAGRMFAVGLMVAMVVLTEGVFEGDISVDTRAFTDALAAITARAS
jgi:hypothetical protein